MAKNELAVIDSTNLPSIVPSAEDMEYIRQELSDMDRLPYGRIKIAAAGAGVFQIYNPGEDDDDCDTDKAVDGVIIMSHKCNGYWPGAYGQTDDKVPACSSIDGENGVLTATGECRTCATCPYNEYGSATNGSGAAGRGKACKNMRRLYIMRRGDILPMVLTLPPTALKAFDSYRTKVMFSRKKMSAIMTHISLRKEKNADGIGYSVPVFEIAGLLNKEEAAAVAAYAAQFKASAERVSVSADDASSANPSAGFTPVNEEPFPEQPDATTPADGEYCPIE